MAFGASRSQQGAQQKTILKRVLRQGQYFVCGVCRKGYPNFGMANGCLTTCMDNLDKSLRVVAKINPQTKQQGYFCPICRRGYSEETQAQQCLDTCKNKSVQTFQAKAATQQQGLSAALSQADAATLQQNAAISGGSQGQSSPSSGAARRAAQAQEAGTGYSIEEIVDNKIDLASFKDDQKKGQEKYMRDGAKYICRRCRTPYFSKEDVIACFDTPCAPTEKVKAEKSDGMGYKLESAPVKSKKDEVSVKFMRDGARYVCRGCSSRYFGREEVETCFDSHNGQIIKKEEDANAPKNATSEENSKFMRDGARYICRNCGKKYFTRDEVIACADGH